MRALKIVGWILGGLLLLVVGVVAAVAIGGDKAMAYLIQHQGAALLHRDIRLGGRFHVAWGNPIRIVADDIHVANASWGTEPDMFAARHLELEIEPWPLLHLKVSIPRVALDGSRTLLETSDKGEKNWDLFAAKAAAPKNRTQFPDVRRVEVTDSSFAFRNGETKANTEVGLAKVLAETPDTASPIKLAGDGTFQKQPYHLEGTVGALAQLQNPTEPYGVDVHGALGDTKLAVSGKMTEPLDIAGLDATVSADGKDLQDTLAAVGLPIPPTPPYHVSGEIKHDGDVWKIEQLETRLGKSQIAGGVSVDTGQRVPYIQANLVAKYLDIADFKGFVGEKPPGSQKEPPKNTTGRIIPDMKLPLEKLPGFNADISFDGADVRPAAGLPLQRVNLGLSLKDGVLRVKPLRFAMANGDVDTDLTLSSAVKPPSLDLNLDVRRIDLHKLVVGMSVPKQVKETTGILGGSLKVKGKGASTREIVGSLDGEFALFMENGQISHILVALLNLDVANALNFLVQG
ncbi:MAG TPA: AsmA family protein, partial [Stellaceae bacterium]